MRRTNLSQLTASTAGNKPQEACLSSFHAATALVLVAFDGLRHRTPPPLSRTGGSSDKRSRALVDEGRRVRRRFQSGGQQSGPDIRRTRRKQQHAPGKKPKPKTPGIAAAPSAMAAIAKVVTVARDANRYAINFLYNQ